MEETFNDNFYSVFKNFTSDLIQVFPEYSEIISENYKDILDDKENFKIDDKESLQNFMNIIHEKSKLIEEKDEKLFEEDIFILEDVSLKEYGILKFHKKQRVHYGNICKHLVC